MAELQFQNPTTPTAQLESRLTGVASDGVTEQRRELIEARSTNEILQKILVELIEIKKLWLEEFK